MKYRGTGATRAREARRRYDGELAIWVPEVKRWLLVVPAYCHLGTMLSAVGEAFANTRRRVQTAMAAYTPIAFKVFGSCLISERRKLSYLIPRAAAFAFQLAHFLPPSSTPALLECGLHARASAHSG